MRTALQLLVGEKSVESFLSEVFEQRFCHYPGVLNHAARPEFFDVALLDEIFSTTPRANLHVISEGRSDALPRFPNGEVDRMRCLEMIRNGATLRVISIQTHSAEMMSFARRLSEELAAHVHINAYLTPPSTRGLKPHFDDHDVFIVQCCGEKHWVLNENYENRVELPARVGPRRDYMRPSPPATEHGVVLKEGDVLYIPRGTLHYATATTAGSVHLTLGCEPVTWAELFRRAIDRAEQHDVRFRRSVSSDLCTSAIEQSAEFPERFRALLLALDPVRSVAAARAALSTRVAAPVSGLLNDIFRPTLIEGSTWWQLEPTFGHSVQRDSEGAAVSVSCHGTRLALDTKAQAYFDRMTQLVRFRAIDLSDAAGREPCLAFLRDLSRLGLVVRA